jgi:hypothetical protein
VESWLAIATLQQRQHLGDFQGTSRPAVYEKERDSSFDIALLVYEVHVDRSMFVDVNLHFVVWERVELRLVRTPVEFGAPVVNDSLDVLSDLLVSFVRRSERVERLTPEHHNPNPACLRAHLEILRHLAVSSTDPASVAERQSCIL